MLSGMINKLNMMIRETEPDYNMDTKEDVYDNYDENE